MMTMSGYRGCAALLLSLATAVHCAVPLEMDGPHGKRNGFAGIGFVGGAGISLTKPHGGLASVALSRARRPLVGKAPAGLTLRMSKDDKKLSDTAESVLKKLAESDKSPAPESSSGDGDEDRKGFVQEMIDWFKTDEGREEAIQWTLTFGMALTFRLLILEPRFIPSLSMFPTFEVGDQLAVDKVSRYWRDYQRRDVVVFRAPPAFARFVDDGKANEDLIKRIVAVEGDTVQVKGGDLYVNGEKQDEPYRNEPAYYSWGPKKVPPGTVLVFGDNRNASLDSHIWGFLPKENIIGRAVVKYWPPNRAGGVQGTPP